MKTGAIAIMRMDEDMEEILRDLPGSGPLFPSEAPGRFRRGEPPRQTRQGQDFFAFGIHAVSLVNVMVTAATWVFNAAA